MASKILVDCTTGASTEVEMTGADLAVFEAQRAQPEPEVGPSRDEQLLAAVDSAKTAVTASKSFTAEQAAVLSAVFDGLGKAITGEAS